MTSANSNSQKRIIKNRKEKVEGGVVGVEDIINDKKIPGHTFLDKLVTDRQLVNSSPDGNETSVFENFN